MLEPWCYTPDQIAKLTRWQVENLYILPAERAAKELDRSMQGKPPVGDGGAMVFESREEFIEIMSQNYPGKSAEDWAVDWEVMQDNLRKGGV